MAAWASPGVGRRPAGPRSSEARWLFCGRADQGEVARAPLRRTQLGLSVVDGAGFPGLVSGAACSRGRFHGTEASGTGDRRGQIPMKVLMLHNRYLLPGGEDQSTAAEASLLVEHGCQVKLLEEDNRRIETLGKARTAVRTLWSAESFRRIRSLLLRERFDVLHVQNFFPLWSPSVYYAAARCGVPVVQTLRNYRLLCVNA